MVSRSCVEAPSSSTAAPPADSDEALLPLRTGGARPPVFMFHPGVRTCFQYLAQSLISAVSPAIPFTAIDPRALDGMAEGSADNRAEGDFAEGVLSVCLNALQRAQPRGPYTLMGWSSGASLAFSVAAKLIARGEKAQLISMDGWAPHDAARWMRLGRDVSIDPNHLVFFDWFTRDLSARHLKPFRVEVETLRPMSFPARAQHVHEVGRRAGLFTNEQGVEEVERRFRRYAEAMTRSCTMVEAMPGHPLELPLLLVRAKDVLLTGTDIGRWMGWDAITPQRSLLEVDGDHFSIMLEPRSWEVGRAIEQWLAREG